MKITNITTYLAKEWRTFMFVVVDTDEGIYGVGEAGITGRELAMAGAIEHFTPLLIGQNPFRTEHIWQTLFRGSFYPAGLILAAAIAAIDIALWDIKGKALGVPVYDLLGGLVRDKVMTYNHLHADSVAGLVARCQESVAEGWKVVRWEPTYRPDHVIEPRESIRLSLQQFEAVRTAVGDDLELCYDVHTKLSVPDAIRFCREVEQYRPFFIEDPLRAENPDSYKRLRGQTAVPLAIGEQYASKWDFRQVIEEEWADYARIDVCNVGGLTEAKKIAGWCETHYIDLAVHNPIGPVATSAALHLNLSCPNFGVMELPRRPGQTMAEVVLNQPEWVDGYLLPPDKPGLGIEFDREAIKKYPFEMTELPHLRREDGSFTNW
jgi:galactonate dehydratase